MTITELRDYLAKYVGEGKGDSLVTVCDKRENPLTEGLCIVGSVFIEDSDGDCCVTLQTG